MSSDSATNIYDPFILTKENRKLELDKIRRFIKNIPKQFRDKIEESFGDVLQYVSFDHFIYINKFRRSINTDILPIGYIDGTLGVICVPTDHSLVRQINTINRYLHIVNLLSRDGVEDWVLDFRSNNGGIIHTFICYIAPFLLERDIVIEVVTKDGNCYEKLSGTIFEIEFPSGFKWIYVMPIYPIIKAKTLRILINRHSYSAAEYVAYLGRLYANAVVHGERSGRAFNALGGQQIAIGQVGYPWGIMEGNEDQFIEPDNSEIPLYPE